MRSLNILIVADVQVTADCIATYIRDLGHFVGGVANNEKQALQLVQNKDIDLTIVDAGITAKASSVHIAASIYEVEPMPIVYVITAPEEVGKIDRYHPGTYISKPVTKCDLNNALGVAFNNFVIKQQGVEERVEHLFIGTNERMVRVLVENILYANAQRAWTDIYTTDKKHTHSRRLKDCLSRLPRKTFCRVHRSYAVNLYKVEAFDRKNIFIRDVTIPIGRTYKDDFLRRIQPF